MSLWNRFFHAEIPARSYLAFRRTVFAAFLAAAAFSPLRHAPLIEPLFRLEPPLLRPWHLPEPGAAWEPLFLLWCASLALAAAGAAGRAPAILACALGLYLGGEYLSFGLSFHEESILALGLVVMAFAPARAGTAWPVRLLRLLLVYIFFTAGIYKLWLNGAYWLSGRAVGDSVSQGWANPGVPALRAWLAGHESACVALSFASLFTELLFPLALLHRRAAALLVPAGFGLVAGIWAVFGYHFALYMAPLFVAWLPWEARGESPAGVP